MNLVKAADDLKNLSDQQLMMAGQNPVVVPPYLVLAEMKRREQLRAEYAKSQQQQQQPTVAQQVVQGMAQGQPQQQPQPQAQGIMQAMPQGAVGMAGGGHVARYADGVPEDAFSAYNSGYQNVMGSLDQMAGRKPTAIDTSSLGLDIDKIKQQLAGKQRAEYLAQVDDMMGKSDYSNAEALVRQQMQQAQGRKPRLGDALIAAGAAMAANRDNRVGLASLLAQAIGTGSQHYETAKREQEKELNTAMMAKVALDKMKQEEHQKRAAAALQLAQFDQNKLIEAYKTTQQNQRFLIGEMSKAKTASEKQQFDLALKQMDFKLKALETAVGIQKHREDIDKDIKVAGIRAADRGANQPDRTLSSINTLSNIHRERVKALGDIVAANPMDKVARKALEDALEEQSKIIGTAQQYLYGTQGGAGLERVNPSYSKVLGAK